MKGGGGGGGGGGERRPITAHFQIWEGHFGPWEISREIPDKIRKVSWKVKTLHF